MAKDETMAAKATNDMFEPLDKQILIMALDLMVKTYQRKENTEQNIDIKRIYAKTRQQAADLRTKVQQ